VERNSKAGQNPPRVVAPIEEEEEEELRHASSIFRKKKETGNVIQLR
jgi:hypothetical protein